MNIQGIIVSFVLAVCTCSVIYGIYGLYVEYFSIL